MKKLSMHRQTTISIVFCLFLFGAAITSEAAILIEFEDNNVIVSTDQEGQTGYQGCQEGSLKEVPAYIFELFVKETPPAGQCIASGKGQWKLVGKQESSEAISIFKNLPIAEYKATVRYGQAIGCDIQDDTKDSPKKSIVYKQEKSKPHQINDHVENTQSTFNSNATNKDFVVYPNPASNELNIILKGELQNTTVKISLVDLLGRQIKQEVYKIEKNQKTQEWSMQVQDISSGVYFLVLENEGVNLFQEKVVMEQGL